MASTTNYNWTTPDDTDLVKNGASAIRSLGSSVDTALWSAGYQAGKNKIINGDFDIWQRGTSITSTSGAWVYSCDRFQSYMTVSSGTLVISRQSFTPGTAPVAGYESTYFLRATAPTTGTSALNFRQSIEDVRTFAGQTVTFSFWAKASATTAGKIKLSQNFGSGGSATVDTALTSVSFTTSWARYTMTATLGSMSGKTIGTSSFLDAYFYTDNNFSSAATIDFWGWQVEAGSIATPFQTATGTKQGELAACQRYYVVFTDGGGVGVFNSSTQMERIELQLPVQMRTAPSVSLSGSILWYDGNNTGTATSLSSTYATDKVIQFGAVAATGTSAQYRIAINYLNVANGDIIASAEL